MSAHEIIGNDALKPGAHWTPGLPAVATLTPRQYAQIIAEAKAAALRDAASALPGFDGIRTHGDAARWLRDRADEIEAGR